MAVREAQANWQGTLQEGKGSMRFGSGAYEGAYSFSSRFEEGTGTNPEELIGAAAAGCFSMALSGQLTRAGHPPDRIDTTAKVNFEKLDDGWTITHIDLFTDAEVPGCDEATFKEKAEATRTGCPVARAFSPTTELRVTATLVGAKTAG